MATKPNRTTQQALDGQVIVGVTKDLQNVSSLPLDGDMYTPTSLVALVQSRIDAGNKVAAAKAAWIDATKQYEAINIKTTGVISGLKSYVMNLFGRTSPKLADFGFAPRKVATLTTAEKVAAVDKRAATRAARGTKGPVARLAVTGETALIAALEEQAAQNAARAASTAATSTVPTKA